MELSEGRVIAGKFRLERCIGQGSMGSIWGARHLGLDAPVAVKFMSPALLGSEMALARFQREAKAAAQIRSPHIVQVLDHGIDEGTPFIAMEWLDGEDLGARLRRKGKLSLQEASVIVNQAAKALAAAHDAGVIHRDLKPSNIFLARVHSEEMVKLLDFGVAKVKLPEGASAKDATAEGALLGTPNYMSPEQVRASKDIDHRSDIWSLGVILYSMVTGKMPFVGESVGDVLVNVCTEPLPPPSTVVFDLAPAVDWFFLRACARDPAQRFQSATELATAFAALASGRQVEPLSRGSLPMSARRSGRVYFVPSSGSSSKQKQGTPLWVILGALLMVLVLALLASKFFERSVGKLFEGM